MEIILSEFVEKYIRTPEDAAQVLEREALRRYHIERSAPRPRKPTGRPRSKEFNQRAEMLREIYRKLKKMMGEEFERLFGEQVARLEAAIAEQDMNTLTEIFDTQPWLRRNGRSPGS